MTTLDYQFLGERLEAVLRETGTTLTPDDLASPWEDTVGDESSQALLLSEHRLPFAAAALVEVGAGPDPRTTSGHRAALEDLERHRDCEALIHDLVAQRDDVLDALLTARDYCRNDSYEGAYGDPYLSIERVLDSLRPTVPGMGPFTPLLPLEYCTECGTSFGHEDDCWVEVDRVQLDERRQHVLRSHLLCSAMGELLVAQILRCLERVEAVAQRARSGAVYAENDGMVVRPGLLLPLLRVHDLQVEFDPTRPASIAAVRHQQLPD